MSAIRPSAEALYLKDLGMLLKEKARAAKAMRTSAAPDEAAYSLGRLMAYHEVISLMQQQALAFGLKPRDLDLEDIDPERDLL